MRPGSGTAVVTKFAYDLNGNAWADLNGSGSLTTRRLYLDAVDALFARIDSGGNTAWYLDDHLGSVRDLMSNSGSILDHIDYSAFGAVSYESSSTNGDRYKFTSREFDSELNGASLAYYRGRYYRFDVGMWQSQDPLRFGAGDSNLYRYVGNNATNARDPAGLDSVFVYNGEAYYHFGPGRPTEPSGDDFLFGTVNGNIITLHGPYRGGVQTTVRLDYFSDWVDQHNMPIRHNRPIGYAGVGQAIGGYQCIFQVPEGVPFPSAYRGPTGLNGAMFVETRPPNYVGEFFSGMRPSNLASFYGIQGTLSGGVAFEVYLGILHFQVDVQVHLGLSPEHGFTVGIGGGAGVQPALGLGASASPILTVTSAPSVHDLNGRHTYLGVSTPYGGIDWFQGHDQQGGHYWGGSLLPPFRVGVGGGWEFHREPIFGIDAGDRGSAVWQPIEIR
jgi:RHS repeat-associated protein